MQDFFQQRESFILRGIHIGNRLREENMELNAQKRGPRLTVHLSGELDHHNAEQARIMLDTLLKDLSVRELVLDLSAVTFMDSAGLGVVLGRYKTVSLRGGKVSVRGMSASIDRIFRMSGIYTLVERQ